MPRSYSPLPWKKTFRKLPPEIEASLKSLPRKTDCVVCCSKLLTEPELQSGIYRHLCIDSTSDIPVEFGSFIPSPNVGPTSYLNATFVERIDKSRGKHTKLIHGRAPTRGRLGLHATTRRQEVWHRLILAPAMSHIAFKRQPEGSNGKGVPVFFQILEVINTSDRKAILRCINLLQENVGRIDLHTVKEAEAESIRRLSEDMGWQVLPDNQHGAVIGRVLRRLGSSQKGSARRIQDRFNFILTLEPHRILHSTRGFVGYFVIEFCDGFTVFENLEIDHAMYVVRGRAEELSRLTRTALHARLGQDVERLVHSKGWEERLRKLVKKVRGDQSPNPDEML